MNILFVCKYNRFRSKVAEAYFNKINKNKSFKAKSAGIVKGFSYKKVPNEFTSQRKFGIEIKKNPQKLNNKLLKWQDIIIIVADNVPKKLFSKYKNVFVWKIIDSANDTPDDKKSIEKSVKQIIKKVDSLLKDIEKMANKKIKVELKKFKLKDYVRFLKTKLSPKTKKEFSKSLMGYIIAGIKSVVSEKKYYRFSVYADNKLVGFGAIFNMRGFYELAIFTLPKYRGKGIATEASRQLVRYCFENLKMNKINIVVEENKTIPLEIIKTLGFKLIKKNEKDNTLLWEKKK